MKKITVVGGGNAGCFTALYCGWFSRKKDDIEVELIYNPDIPPERVGQATTLDPPKFLWAATGFDWYNNPIHATFKSGILYEGWGKKNDKFFHPFPADHMAMHYCPWEMQETILKSGHFKVTKSDILDVSKVDSDYVFDCQGKPRDYSEYDELKNPTNAAILGRPNWDLSTQHWSRAVTTPDGWAFIIPTDKSSPSNDYCVGYCYNSNITNKEDAEKNFLDMFDVEIKKHLNYRNYVAKDPVIDDRIFLNGNRLFFLEPLESSSTQTYIEIVRAFFDYYLPGRVSLDKIRENTREYMIECQNFLLWHYKSGSKYDTPFWKYATSLEVEYDDKFKKYYEWVSKNNRYDSLPNVYGGIGGQSLYGQWPAYSFRNWYEGINTKLNT